MKTISRPSEIPPEVLRYILERWSEYMKPIKQRFVEAGLAGTSFVEKAPDLPLSRLKYSFNSDGVLVFDWDAKDDTADTMIVYRDFETGYRALMDKDFDSMQAFQEGAFKLEPSPEIGLKMAEMMPEMIEAHIKAVEDAEKKFKISLPKY